MGSEKTRQLFHSVDIKWNDEGIIFGQYLQFGDQAQIVTTGLHLYLKHLYGDIVEFYSSPCLVSMQSKKRWNKENGDGHGMDNN